MKQTTQTVGAILFLACLALSQAANWSWDDVTPLDEYLARPDDDIYGWEVIDFYNMSNLGCNAHVLNVTSHRWMTPEHSNRHIWFHFQLIFLPLDEPDFTDSAFLFIEGGKTTGGPPAADNDFAIFLCGFTGLTNTVSTLHTINPNQPIIYADDPEQESRSEDDSVAYTWRQYLDNPDNPEKILEFPQAKGAVRAMDTLQQWGTANVPGSNFQNFMVGGGSKRGWASWMAALGDRRVKAVAPLVISILNTQLNFHHSYENLGGWSFAMADYWEKNITKAIDTPEATSLFENVDPYSYRARLDMPKLIGCATGDEFFSPDDSYDFFDGLSYPKYMLMLQNAEHTLFGKYRRISKAIAAVWMARLRGLTMPQLTWVMSETPTGGRLDLTTDTVPSDVVAYYGDNHDDVRRDFRVVSIEPGDILQPTGWRNISTEIVKVDDYNYYIELERSPNATFRGFFFNVYFPFPDAEIEYDVTTEVNIIPWTRPFPPCVGEGCYGKLV